jgi:uncharacterized short protein YbdD (DUF466 family)
MRGERNLRKGRKERTQGGAGFRLFRHFRSLIRDLAGMPDYQRHIEHLRRCHPERPIPTERQYFAEYLERRYQDGPTRCC